MSGAMSGLPVAYHQIIAAVIVAVIAYITLAAKSRLSGIPTIPGHDSPKHERIRYATSAREVIWKGIRLCRSTFQVCTFSGPKVILPPHFLEEVKDHKSLSFLEFTKHEFFASFPGFETMHIGSGNPIINQMLRNRLGQSLALFTPGLLEETAEGFEQIFSPTTEWKECYFVQNATDLITRLSCRVFLGKDMCSNLEWLSLSTSYSIQLVTAVNELRHWPAPLRRLANRFLPSTRQLRVQLERARQLVRAELRSQRQWPQEKAAASPALSQWFAEIDGFDHELAQVALAAAAIHNTSGLLSNVMFDLCQQPECMEALREEAVAVLQEDGGWKKTTPYKLKLMDSVLKESQRLNPISLMPMSRRTTAGITLSDGTTIPTNTAVGLSAYQMTDPAVFPSPDTFDGRRFLELRSQPGAENRWQFATPTPQHLGFGYGSHACPGRFFAAHELKIVLCHLLTQCEWRFVEGETRPATLEIFEALAPDPRGKLQYRKRV